jgi:hypothetical protein
MVEDDYRVHKGHAAYASLVYEMPHFLLLAKALVTIRILFLCVDPRHPSNQ